MKKVFKITVFLMFNLVFAFGASTIKAQDKDTSQESSCGCVLVQKETPPKSEQEELDEIREETRFRSPFRYVIVYNDLLDTGIPNRYIQVLMDEKAFNEKNLRELFALLKNRCPQPKHLTVVVRTSLDTIETPEENEKARSQMEAGRLTDAIKKHKDAFYFLKEDGEEFFTYTTSLAPKRKKIVKLN
jgi:hypothetical protein